MLPLDLLLKVIKDVETLKQPLSAQPGVAVKCKQYVHKFNSHTMSLKFEILQLVQVLYPLRNDFASCIAEKNNSKLTGLICASIIQLGNFCTRVTNLLKIQQHLLNEFVDNQTPEDINENIKVLEGLDLKLLNFEFDILNIFVRFIENFEEITIEGSSGNNIFGEIEKRVSSTKNILQLFLDFLGNINNYLSTYTVTSTGTQIPFSDVMTDPSSSITDLFLKTKTLITTLVDNMSISHQTLSQFGSNFANKLFSLYNF